MCVFYLHAFGKVKTIIFIIDSKFGSWWLLPLIFRRQIFVFVDSFSHLLDQWVLIIFRLLFSSQWGLFLLSGEILIIIVNNQWNLTIVSRHQLRPICIMSNSLVDLLYKRFLLAISIATSLSYARGIRNQLVISIGSIIKKWVIIRIVHQSWSQRR